MVLICIFLIISDVQLLFVYPLAMKMENGLFGKMSYLEKCLFISAHFKTGFSFLLLSPLYVLNINHLSVI